jgi:hypothetical protein
VIAVSAVTVAVVLVTWVAATITAGAVRDTTRDA